MRRGEGREEPQVPLCRKAGSRGHGGIQPETAEVALSTCLKVLAIPVHGQQYLSFLFRCTIPFCTVPLLPLALLPVPCPSPTGKLRTVAALSLHGPNICPAPTVSCRTSPLSASCRSFSGVTAQASFCGGRVGLPASAPGL